MSNLPEDLKQRIEKTIAQDRIMLFMKGSPAMPQCGFSAAVVQILKQVGVTFGSVNILADAELREGLKQYANWPTYPAAVPGRQAGRRLRHRAGHARARRAEAPAVRRIRSVVAGLARTIATLSAVWARRRLFDSRSSWPYGGVLPGGNAMMKVRALSYALVAALALVAAAGTAQAQETAPAAPARGGLGVGVAAMLRGPSGLNVVFDGGRWHADAILGIAGDDGGGPGWRAPSSISAPAGGSTCTTAANADFSLGGGLGFQNARPGRSGRIGQPHLHRHRRSDPRVPDLQRRAVGVRAVWRCWPATPTASPSTASRWAPSALPTSSGNRKRGNGGGEGLLSSAARVPKIPDNDISRRGADEPDFIVVRGAREHNLDIDELRIPKRQLVVFTGVSGSGKSSLAFDTLYAEGQRRYVESLSAYARQFLGQMEKPRYDQLRGLSPTIAIEQKSASSNPRSTVGTVTEIYDYLRVLYARAGEQRCHLCAGEVAARSAGEIVEELLEMKGENKVTLLARKVENRKGEFREVLEEARKAGFARVRINGLIQRLEDVNALDKKKKHTVDIVVDRVTLGAQGKAAERARLADSVETALKAGGGSMLAAVEGEKLERHYSEARACPACGVGLPELVPQLFSFNSPLGMCIDCNGLGSSLEIDPDLVVPNHGAVDQRRGDRALGPAPGQGQRLDRQHRRRAEARIRHPARQAAGRA